MSDPQEPNAQPPGNNRAKHSNSRGRTIAMALGALCFIAVCAVIALGAGGGDTSGQVAVDTAPVAGVAAPVAEEPAVAEPAIAEEPVAEEPVAEEAIAEEPVADEPVVAEEPVAEAPAGVEAAAEDAEVEEAPAEEAPAEDAPVEAVRADLPPSPPSPPGAPDVHSVSAGGVLFMRGTLPSEEIRDQVVAAVELVIGPGNAISEHTIDPSVPYIPGASNPVYVVEKVLFETGSSEIAEPFYPLLAPLPVLQQLQPTVVVTITGHSDSVGSAAGNLELSQDRVDAVRDWVIAQGGDPTRLIAVGMGDSQPIADNATPEGRALNRRVEFLIAGFDSSIDR